MSTATVPSRNGRLSATRTRPSERKVAADGDYVLARYNLACAASLAGDTAKAAAQLRWLSGSDDRDASDAILKARTDPDLEAARKLPEVRKLIGL